MPDSDVRRVMFENQGGRQRAMGVERAMRSNDTERVRVVWCFVCREGPQRGAQAPQYFTKWP